MAALNPAPPKDNDRFDDWVRLLYVYVTNPESLVWLTSGLHGGASKVLGFDVNGVAEELARSGTGSVAFTTSPTFVTPTLGAAVGTSLALGGGTALATTNRTGTGNLVLENTPTLITPVIGAATGTSLTVTSQLHAASGSAIPAGGTAGLGLRVSSTSNFGVFFGSGAPSLSAAKGSLYMRSDGSGTNDRAYVNTNGSTTWTAIVTVA